MPLLNPAKDSLNLIEGNFAGRRRRGGRAVPVSRSISLPEPQVHVLMFRPDLEGSRQQIEHHPSILCPAKYSMHEPEDRGERLGPVA